MASPAPLTNNPPPLKDRLQADHAKMAEAVAEIIAKANDLAAKTIEDDEGVSEFSDLIKDLAKYSKRVEAIRVDEKEPFLESGRVVDGFFKEFDNRLKKASTALNAVLTRYLNEKAAREREARIRAEEEQRRIAEEARRKADEELRKAQEAEAAARKDESERRLRAALAADQQATSQEVLTLRAERAAVAAPADLARTRGASSLATLTRSWEFEVIDLGAIPLDAIRAHIPRAAIEQAIRSFVRAGGRELAGVRIYEDSRASVR